MHTPFALGLATAFIFFGLTTKLAAQKNYQQGYVVTLQGDTIHGYIDLKEWNNNPSQISFSNNRENGKTTYDVNSIRYFEVLNRDAYQRATVNISMDAVDVNNLNTIDSSSATKTVFLKVIVQSNGLRFYAYTDALKERSYITDSGQAVPQELVYKYYYRKESDDKAVTDGRKTVVDNSFRNQLIAIMYRKNLYSKAFLEQILRTDYKASALKQIVMQLNQNGSSETRNIEAKMKTTRFFMGAGINRTHLSFDGDIYLAKNATESSSLLPAFSAGFDIFAKPTVRRLLLRGELGFRMSDNKVTSSSSTIKKGVYYLSSSTFSFSPQVLYHVYKTKKIAVPIGAGVSANVVAKYGKNYSEETDVYDILGTAIRGDRFELNKFYVQLVARAGIAINEKVEISLIYLSKSSLVSYSRYSANYDVLQFHVNYMFNRNGKK